MFLHGSSKRTMKEENSPRQQVAVVCNITLSDDGGHLDSESNPSLQEEEKVVLYLKSSVSITVLHADL